MATKINNYRVYAATTKHGGVQGTGQGDEYYEAATAAEAAQMAADDWGWDEDDWDGGDVIVATDDDGDSYHMHR